MCFPIVDYCADGAMTIFEYVSVAISIIVALAIAEGLRGLRSTLDSSKRYGIHATWLFIKLAAAMFYWWSAWRLRDIPEVWNMYTFTLALLMPSIMYLQLHSLVSNDPDQIDDWRRHFYDQRRWFFGLNTFLAVCTVHAFSYFSASLSQQVLPIIAYGVVAVLSIAGFLSDNARLHGVIAATIALFNFIYWWVISFRPPVIT